MIRSMTGFGEAEHSVEGGRLRVEIKTVNHRFLNASVRTPPGFDRVEHEIQQCLRPYLARGHATVSVTLDRDETVREDDLPVLDVARAGRYAELLRSLQRELGLAGEVEIGALARFNDVFRTPDVRSKTLSAPMDVLKPVVEEAARAVVEMREAEGARLCADMEGRLCAMAGELEEIQARAPERLLAERDRLRAQIRELTESDDVDPDRLAREIAYLAEKWDINEEIVRFRSHVELFGQALNSNGGEPVGKRLSFLVQEMHREANTIGSKANDVAIGHAAVALKEEIERLREQVENVE